MARTPTVSFEIFPAATEAADQSLERAMGQLSTLNPDCITVTYGADGSGQQRSVQLVERLLMRDRPPVAAHLTCVGATRDEFDALARRWWGLGLRRIVALRGDVPGGGPWQPCADGYQRAADLVAGLKRVADFDIAVAAYPETHPAAASPDADIDNLKAKQDAGASTAITQYCFDVEPILRLRDRAVKAGIQIPVVPGILPVTNFARVVTFSKRCGASVPDWLAAQFDGLDDDPETRSMVAASVATEQCQRLLAEGFDRFHFYTLNRGRLTYAICRRLGLQPGVERAA